MYYLGALKEMMHARECVCVYEQGMEDPLTTLMQLISNAIPARCNQDGFLFCRTILKFLSGKSRFRFTMEGVKNPWM